MKLNSKQALALYIPMGFGVCIFGYLGIFFELIIRLNLDIAINWLTTFSLRPPPEYRELGVKYIGNYVGIFLGIGFGWYVEKFIIAKRIDLE